MKNLTSARASAILDANVIFAYRKRDILLRFCEDRIFEARWSEQILDEWTRNVLNLFPKIEDSILSQQRAMAKHFPDAFVEGHEPLAAALVLPDPDDRHVLAAAIHSGSQVIVTDNISDFPAKELDAYRIEAMTADGFLARLFDLHRDEALPALRRMLSEYSKPAYSPSEFFQDLTAKGLPKLAARASEHW